jgi:hypothetical protein
MQLESTEWELPQQHRCQCGAVGCREFIEGGRFLAPGFLKQRYGELLPRFVKERESLRTRPAVAQLLQTVGLV